MMFLSGRIVDIGSIQNGLGGSPRENAVRSDAYYSFCKLFVNLRFSRYVSNKDKIHIPSVEC